MIYDLARGHANISRVEFFRGTHPLRWRKGGTTWAPVAELQDRKNGAHSFTSRFAYQMIGTGRRKNHTVERITEIQRRWREKKRRQRADEELKRHQNDQENLCPKVAEEQQEEREEGRLGWWQCRRCRCWTRDQTRTQCSCGRHREGEGEGEQEVFSI